MCGSVHKFTSMQNNVWRCPCFSAYLLVVWSYLHRFSVVSRASWLLSFCLSCSCGGVLGPVGVYLGSAMRPGLILLPLCIQTAQMWVWASERPEGGMRSWCCAVPYASSALVWAMVGTVQLLWWLSLCHACAHAWQKSVLHSVTGLLSRAFSKGRWDF